MIHFFWSQCGLKQKHSESAAAVSSICKDNITVVKLTDKCMDMFSQILLRHSLSSLNVGVVTEVDANRCLTGEDPDWSLGEPYKSFLSAQMCNTIRHKIVAVF